MIFLLLENMGRLLQEWAQRQRERYDEPIPYIVRDAWCPPQLKYVKEEKPSCDVSSV